MARQKKDGKMVSLYLDAEVMNRLEEYAKEKGQTKTMAMERLLTKGLDEHDKEHAHKA